MGPFESTKAAPADPDRIADALERGARARQILNSGVADDLARRREQVLRQAELELRSGTLTPDRALMHVACCNALRRYLAELEDDIRQAERAAERLHADETDLEDGSDQE